MKTVHYILVALSGLGAALQMGAQYLPAEAPLFHALTTLDVAVVGLIGVLCPSALSGKS